MKVFGLTGGIASGKSTVATMFAQLGAPVVDADQIARRVVEPGQPALAELRERFGDRILDAQGRLDRTALGKIVFADSGARRAVNAITHPRIAAASQAELAQLAASGARTALYEAALIVENGLHKTMAGLIVVSVPRSVQVQRLMSRDGLDRASAEARIEAQLPLADKIAVADYVIDNSGDLDQTRDQVEGVWVEIANDQQQ